MSETIADSLKSADGVRLAQSQYLKDFDDNLWRVDGANSWKLECLQNYSEVGFPSWDAFMAGDWNGALQLYEAERPNLIAFNQEFQRHRSHLYRVRVLVYPITPYVQWEFHCLRLRAECGEKIRLVNLSEASTAESADPLPELISLCGRVLYHIICDDDQKSDGAIRYDDPKLISHYEQFARDLYGGGEDIESYFRRRKIADLPPPRP